MVFQDYLVRPSVDCHGLDLIYLITHFMELPVQTKLSLGFSKLHLPAVTICNINVIKREHISTNSRAMKELIDSADPMKNLASTNTLKKKIQVIVLQKIEIYRLNLKM